MASQAFDPDESAREDWVRAHVHRAVEKYPGVHGRGVAQMAGCSPQLALYHLEALRGAGALVAFTDGGFVRWYPRHPLRPLNEIDTIWLAHLRSPMRRRLVEVLLARPASRHAELLAHVDAAPSTVSYHLARLAAADIVVRDDDSGRWRVSEPARLARLLRDWPALPWDASAKS